MMTPIGSLLTMSGTFKLQAIISEHMTNSFKLDRSSNPHFNSGINASLMFKKLFTALQMKKLLFRFNISNAFLKSFDIPLHAIMTIIRDGVQFQVLHQKYEISSCLIAIANSDEEHAKINTAQTITHLEETGQLGKLLVEI